MKVTIKSSTRNLITHLLSMKIEIEEINISKVIEITPLQLFELIPRPTQESLDLLYFTVYISIIDRLISRTLFADNWTRYIEIEIPVSSPQQWNQAKETFEKALSFLSGDIWILKFTTINNLYFLTPELQLYNNNNDYNKISLFSGGLDSLIGAIDLAEEQEGIILTSYYDGSGAIKDKQGEIYSIVKERYSNKKIFLSQFSLTKIKSLEQTTRARSVLFLGLSIYTAINLDIKEIITPENGLISINLPLTASRGGANSTRTMHPYFIKTFTLALHQLGHQISIINPYIFKTKGEMLLECKEHKILNILIEKSISCSHPTMKQSWYRREKNINHCGYCIPCIIRRASINKYNPLIDRGEDYGIDIFNEAELKLSQDGIIPQNIKAILKFISKNYPNNKLRKQVNQTVRIDNLDEITNMLKNGYEEIRTLITMKGTVSMKSVINGK